MKWGEIETPIRSAKIRRPAITTAYGLSTAAGMEKKRLNAA